MLSNFLQFVKVFLRKNQKDIILFSAVMMISLLSFSIGYILTNLQEKQPIKFDEQKMNNN
ncbi:MAG: hypothetical protein ABH956_00375 [Candidatus Nealsonbacteria bacterium]